MAVYAEIHRWTDQYGVVTNVIDFGSHVPEAGDPFYFIDIAGYTPQPVQGEAWWYDFQGDLFTSTDPVITKPKPPAPTMNAFSLWFERFTADERAKTWAICRKDDPAGVSLTLAQRYRIASFRDVTLSGLTFPLDDPECVAVVNGLETAGVLDPGRAAEILDW